jgi:Zinc finger, C3HC4 type (RING finger)
LSCPDCNVKVFNMKELVQHKKNCPERICVICMDKHASSILEPCLHHSFCAECIYRVLQTSTRCPICRSEVIHVHGQISYASQEILLKGARIAIVNFEVVSQGEALAIVNWRQFMANINNDVLEATKLIQVGEMMAFAWPQILEKANQLVHEMANEFVEL